MYHNRWGHLEIVVWVCKFLSTLINGHTPSCAPGAAKDEAMNFRYHMVEAFYTMALGGARD